MNKEGKKTAIFAGVAAVAVLLVLLTGSRARSAHESEGFRNQGEEFYPAFKDSLKAAALEVIDYDELTGTPKPFKVQVVNGMWSIPSHHNYPADGKDRLAKTAASVMDLKKERIASDNPKDHEELGVVDPLDPAAKGTRGRGKRVRLFDASGSTLADYVFGKDTKEGGGHRYVRVPDQKQTYAVKVAPEISVKFEDWVETDLLKVGSATVKKVTIDRYSFNLDDPTPKNRSTQYLSRDDSAAPWKVNELKDNEEINTDTINTLTSTLSGLKLTGVRPKPPQVAKVKDLNELGKIPVQTLRAAAQSMYQHGIYIMSDGKNNLSVVSSEGEEEVACDDGVVYRLLFGEALVGSAEEISAGSEEKKDEKKDPKDKKDEKKPDGGSENRYLFVSVRHDDALVGPLPVEPKPYVADPAKKPEEQKADEEKAKKDKEEFESKKKDLEKKKEEGRKRAAQLGTRFGEWYYVISADAFKKLRVERAQLVKAKEVPKDEKKPEDKKVEPKKDEPKKEEPKKEEPKKEEPKKEESKKEEPKKEEKKP
jgi:hypothetical protein